jgi:hypothetical protein
VLRSVEQAADPTRFPEQITQAGLEPWHAKKVLGCLTNGQLGTINLTTSQVAARLFLAPKTIRNRVSDLVGKLEAMVGGAKSMRAELGG